MEVGRRPKISSRPAAPRRRLCIPHYKLKRHSEKAKVSCPPVRLTPFSVSRTTVRKTTAADRGRVGAATMVAERHGVVRTHTLRDPCPKSSEDENLYALERVRRSARRADGAADDRRRRPEHPAQVTPAGPRHVTERRANAVLQSGDLNPGRKRRRRLRRHRNKNGETKQTRFGTRRDADRPLRPPTAGGIARTGGTGVPANGFRAQRSENHERFENKTLSPRNPTTKREIRRESDTTINRNKPYGEIHVRHDVGYDAGMRRRRSSGLGEKVNGAGIAVARRLSPTNHL